MIKNFPHQKKILLFLFLGIGFWMIQGIFLRTFFTPYAIFETNFGTFEVQLYNQQAPKTVQNFIGLASSGKYNQSIFHRLIKGFILQGGDYESANGQGGESFWGKPFEDEFSKELSHVKGVISMANRGEANTNQSQFFFVLADNPDLDGKHSIFGQVSKGIEVLDDLENKAVDRKNTPIEPLIIQQVKIYWKWGRK